MDVLRTQRAAQVFASVLTLALLGACTKLRSADDRRAEPPVDATVKADGDASLDTARDADLDRDAAADASDVGQDAASSGNEPDASRCDGACACVPTITSCDRTLVAHGARLVIRGECLEHVDSVSIGDVSQQNVRTTVSGRVELVVDAVDDATPVGLMRPLVLSWSLGESEAFPITVAHLVVSELDAISGGDHDNREFVEIASGLGEAVDLAGYAVVFVDGASDATYTKPAAFVLGVTNPNGRVVLGNSGVAGVSQRFPAGTLGQGRQAHAVLLLQIPPSGMPPTPGTSVTSIDGRLIDSVVFGPLDAEHDTTLLSWCFPLEAGREEVHEASGGPAVEYALRRCGDARRDGRVFGAARPTPNAPNGCP